MSCPGFYFCICPDSALSSGQVRRQIPAWFGQAEPEQYAFWADDGLDAAFWDKLTLAGFNPRPRLLKLRQAQNLSLDDWKKLSARLAVPRPGILPVFFLEAGWEKGKPKLSASLDKLRCLEFARKQGWVWQNPGLTPALLGDYLQQCASERNLSFEPGVARLLAETVTPDAAAIQSIFDQLALLSQTGKITAPMVAELAAHTPDLAVFDLIRNLEQGRADLVWPALLAEADGGEALLFSLLALLTREARLLWQSLHGNQSVFPSFIAEEKHKLARQLGPRGLAGVFEQAARAEYAVKSGTMPAPLALDRLIFSLLRIFSA